MTLRTLMKKTYTTRENNSTSIFVKGVESCIIWWCLRVHVNTVSTLNYSIHRQLAYCFKSVPRGVFQTILFMFNITHYIWRRTYIHFYKLIILLMPAILYAAELNDFLNYSSCVFPSGDTERKRRNIWSHTVSVPKLHDMWMEDWHRKV